MVSDATSPKTPNTADSQGSNKRKQPVEGSTPRRVRAKADFSEGGDLTLKSIDERTFSVHSIILSIASPIFADMFDVGLPGPGQVVDLAETGEMIDLMLRFIYPNEPPTIASFEMLNKAMHVAKKYELEGMQRHLRRELAMSGSSVSYSSDPLGAFVFATAHDLADETKVSLDLARRAYQFNTVDDLLAISKAAPASIPWILLFGIPCLKKKMLSEVLLKFHDEPMKLLNYSFLCSNCRAHKPGRYSPPEWQARWAHGLVTELAQRPIDTWGPLFEGSYVSEVLTRNGGIPDRKICLCVENCSSYAALFLEWSSGVSQCLSKRLEGMDKLEKLVA